MFADNFVIPEYLPLINRKRTNPLTLYQEVVLKQRVVKKVIENDNKEKVDNESQVYPYLKDLKKVIK